MKRLLVLFFLVFAASTIILTGCATPTKQAIFLDPGFQPRMIDQIILLPIVDVRLDKKIKGNFDGYIRSKGMYMLQKNGYQIMLSDNIGEINQITEDDLKSGDSEWIRRLGPSDARYVMVMVLLSVGSGFHGFGSSGMAELAGFLYDKNNGIIVWRDKGSGSVSGGGGLMGLAAKSSLAWKAITAATLNLLSSIPKRTSK